MKQTKQFKIALAVLGTILLVIVGILSFYILYNAQWLIGDDHIIMNRTGWDIPFTIWDTIKPEIGRFFPLAYMHENLVLLFPGNIHSATQHYVINLILFLILTFALLATLWNILKPSKIIDLIIIFVATILCISRLYIVYINVFSSIYQYYTITAVLLFCFIMYYKTLKKIYGVLALLCTLYVVFCGENVFIIPLSIGVITLLLGKNYLSKQQIIFNIALISIAIVMLLIYFFGIYLHADREVLYDPSHGTGVTFVENAIAIIKGQKFLVLAAIIWSMRQMMLILKKDSFHIVYDTLLWAAGATLLGGLILKLDWQLYYYTAILYALPSTVHFSIKHFKSIPTLIILCLFAGLHSHKIPIYIQQNQQDRSSTINAIAYLSEKNDNNANIVWYESNVTDSTSYDLVMRDFRKNSLKSYMQFYRKDKKWDYSNYEIDRDCIVLYPIENDKFSEKPVLLSNRQFSIISNIYIYTIPATKNIE